jgi:hypothetical protein
MDKDERELFEVDQFIFGLNDINLMRHVQFGHPLNLNAAEDLATEYESTEVLRAAWVLDKKPQGTVSPVLAEIHTPSSQRLELESELAKVTKANSLAIGNLAKAVLDQQHTQGNKEDRSNNVPRQNPIQDKQLERNQWPQANQGQRVDQKKQKGACFVCGDKTHYANQCPQNPKSPAFGQRNKPGQSENQPLNQIGLPLGPAGQA